ELPKSYSERLSLCETIIAGQDSLRNLRSFDSLGRSAFGNLWHGEKSNWDQGEAILSWVARQEQAGLDETFRRAFSEVQDQKQVATVLEDITNVATLTKSQLQEVGGELNLNCESAFGVATLHSVSIEKLGQRCNMWLSDMEGLSRWNNYYVRSLRARELQL